jgi:hypothetical protein
MWNFFEISYSLFFHSILIISVYERAKRLIKAIRESRQTKSSSIVKTEILLFAIVLIGAVLLYKFGLYDRSRIR